MSTLICGSLALDSIMRFEGRFADVILPEQLHKLSVSFYVPDLKREYGGCAGNIAYAMKLLGGEPLPMAAIGHDGQAYLDRFETLGISTEFVQTVPTEVTALAMIMTDNDNNQITAFHPGAMAQAHCNVIVPELKQRRNIQLGIVSPDGRQAMMAHAQQLKAADIPFIFDPGQGLPMFDGHELREFISLCTWVTVNDYEATLLEERAGWRAQDIAQKVRGYIVTLGGKGAQVWEGSASQVVPAVRASAVIDPTGCGDAFRGALLFGLEQAWPLAKCVACGNRVAAVKIASTGGQNYTLS